MVGLTGPEQRPNKGIPFGYAGLDAYGQPAFTTAGIDPTGQASSVAGIIAVLEATGVCLLGPGNYLIDSPVTLSGSRTYAIVAPSSAVTNLNVTHNGTAFVFPQSSAGLGVRLAGFTATAANSTGLTAGLAHITFPQADTAPTLQGITAVQVEDVYLASPGYGTGHGTWQSGLNVEYGWFQLLRNFSGELLSAASSSPGNSLYIFNGCINSFLSDCWCYNGHSLLWQSGQGAYAAQGVDCLRGGAVGSNWLIDQWSGAATATVGPIALSLLELFLTNVEIATVMGGLNLKRAIHVASNGNDYSAWAGVTNPVWRGVQLDDCQQFRSATDRFNGGGSNSKGVYCITDTGAASGCVGNTLVAPFFENCGSNNVEFGPGTAQNRAYLCESGDFKYADNGGISSFPNTITVKNADGGESSVGNRKFAAHDGSTLFTIVDLANAVNSLVVLAGATGNPATLEVAGTDTDVTMQLLAKGKFGFSFLNGNGVLFVFGQVGTGAQANYISSFSNAAGNAPSLQATGSDTNISLQISSKGTGLVYWGNNAAVGGSLGTNQIALDGVSGLSVIEWDSGTSKFVFLRNGVRIASIDGSGNMTIKGSLIQNGTP